MLSSLKAVFDETVLPLFRPPPMLQMAALCHRKTNQGREVLLVTSSHGRWILPKGWPIKGKSGSETAMQEAWEEAGVKSGKVSEEPIGTISTRKRFDAGHDVPCEITVYPIEVTKVANDFPEAKKRDRRWATPEEAADLVEDPKLSALLREF